MTPGTASAEFYRGILDHMLEGCQILDFEWRYLFINAAAEIHNRRPRTELLGQRYEVMWPGIEETEVYAVIRDVLKNRDPQWMENHFTYPDGKDGWFELRISPVPEGVFIMSLDISERKVMEAELQQTEEQLLQAQKLEAIGQLTGGIAHDFNNLLAVIQCNTELLNFELEKARIRSTHIHDLQSTCQRAAQLTRQLLAFSRKQILRPEVIYINEVVEAAGNMLHRIIGENIDLKLDMSSDIAPTLLDPGQLEQIVMNLAVNARDAMPSGGTLKIRTATTTLDESYSSGHLHVAPGTYVELVVSDTGMGMSKETQRQVFEPFFTTKETGKGTGLGLSTVYGIVKQSGGSIWLYSELGKGSTFKIYFPVAEDVEHVEKPEPEYEVVQFNNEQVLVVEDDEILRKAICEILASMGLRIMSASSGEEAFNLVTQYPTRINLLLTDVILPEMHGAHLGDSVSRLYPDIKVLYMSGYTDDIIAKQGVLVPGISLIEKPFTKEQLSQAIARQLQ